MATRILSQRNLLTFFGGVVSVSVLAFTVWSIAKGAEPPPKPLSIAVVDTQKIFDGYVKTQEANKTLEAAVKRLEEQGKAMNDEILRLEEQLSKQRLFVDDPQKIQAWEREIAQKREELRRFVTTGDNALRDKQDELSKPILEEIRAAIQEWGKTHGYNLILEKQLIALYHEPDMDITDAILNMLNERAANAPTTSKTEAEKGPSGTTNTPNTPQGKPK